MADYLSCTTINYFQVTSEQELRELVSHIDCNTEIKIATSKENEKTYYSLCAYGSFMGLDDREDLDKLYTQRIY